MAKKGWIRFFVFFITGLYFVSKPFEVFTLPETLIPIEKWFFLFAGILLIIGGIYFKKSYK